MSITCVTIFAKTKQKKGGQVGISMLYTYSSCRICKICYIIITDVFIMNIYLNSTITISKPLNIKYH